MSKLISPVAVPDVKDDVRGVVDALAPATAEELQRMALQRRFDRKFLVPASRVADVLRDAGDGYHVVLAGSARFALYETTYFDTPDLGGYHAHRRARRPRFKIRIRNYVDRDLSMLEFKEKTGRGDTRKLRWERPEATQALTPEDLEHLRGAVSPGLDVDALLPQARTLFYRLMLVNTDRVERATLDFGLTLTFGDARRVVADLVVVEVKDGGRGTASPLVAALRHHGARTLAFSKYCMAVAMLSHERANEFLPSMRAVGAR